MAIVSAAFLALQRESEHLTSFRHNPHLLCELLNVTEQLLGHLFRGLSRKC